MTHLPKRAWIELQQLERLKTERKFLIDKSPFDGDEETPTNFTFIGRILPRSEPFNQTALQIEIQLPQEYPYKPPSVRILTKVYHPNVEENGNRIKKPNLLLIFYLCFSGRICLEILSPTGSWTPSFRLTNVINEMIDVIDHPNLNLPVNDCRIAEIQIDFQ